MGWDAVFAQKSFIQVLAGSGTEEDGYVFAADGAYGIPVAHRIPRGKQSGNGPRYRLGLGFMVIQCVGIVPVVLFVGESKMHFHTGFEPGMVPEGLYRGEAGFVERDIRIVRSGCCKKNRGKNPVEQIKKRFFRAVVGIEAGHVFFAKLPGKGAEHRNIGAAEPVNGLFLVAYEKQFVRTEFVGAGKGTIPSFFLFRKQEKKVLLKIVVVLEFVDHDGFDAVLVSGTEFGIGDEGVHGHAGYIGKSENAGFPLFGVEDLLEFGKQGKGFPDYVPVQDKIAYRGKLAVPMVLVIAEFFLECKNIRVFRVSRFADSGNFIRCRKKLYETVPV